MAKLNKDECANLRQAVDLLNIYAESLWGEYKGIRERGGSYIMRLELEQKAISAENTAAELDDILEKGA